jgi:hypothetical protein
VEGLMTTRILVFALAAALATLAVTAASLIA